MLGALACHAPPGHKPLSGLIAVVTALVSPEMVEMGLTNATRQMFDITRPLMDAGLAQMVALQRGGGSRHHEHPPKQTRRAWLPLVLAKLNGYV